MKCFLVRLYLIKYSSKMLCQLFIQKGRSGWGPTSVEFLKGQSSLLPSGSESSTYFLGSLSSFCDSNDTLSLSGYLWNGTLLELSKCIRNACTHQRTHSVVIDLTRRFEFIDWS